MAGPAERILLDTDIGSDIDDALCLAYLLARPDCELAGITTVSGQPERRAAMASALCRAAGRDVPIHAGSPLPLLVEQQQPTAPQAEALAAGGRVRWPHRADFPPATAVEFLRRTIRGDPGNLTLLAIGPLTNLALLFRLDPEIPSLLKRLVLMCGTFLGTPSRHGGAEWNALCDPHAASIVYAAPVGDHRSVGLDVTTQVSISADEARRRFQNGLLAPVLDFAEVWFRKAARIVFHDPMAAVSIFEPGLCRFERGTVRVGLEGDAAGRTAWTPSTDGPHQVAVAVDPPRVLDAYFGAFDGAFDAREASRAKTLRGPRLPHDLDGVPHGARDGLEHRADHLEGAVVQREPDERSPGIRLVTDRIRVGQKGQGPLGYQDGRADVDREQHQLFSCSSRTR